MTEVAPLTGEGTLPKLKQLIGKELRELLPPTTFFFIAFHILVLFRALMLRQFGIELSSVAGATVAALLVGKVVLFADALPLLADEEAGDPATLLKPAPHCSRLHRGVAWNFGTRPARSQISAATISTGHFTANRGNRRPCTGPSERANVSGTIARAGPPGASDEGAP